MAQCFMVDVGDIEKIYLAARDIDSDKPNPVDVAYLQGLIEMSLGRFISVNEVKQEDNEDDT